METKTFSNGERVLSKGEDAVTAYIVESGNVRVFLEQDGREVTLAELGPQAMFGETALFGGGTYGANVEAVGDTVLRVITPERYEDIIGTCDPVIRSIIHMLIERQRKTNEALLKSETREFMDLAFI